MAKWNDNGKFVLFKKTNEVKQISHIDNAVIWFTDKTYLYSMDWHTVKPITLKQITKLLNKLTDIKKLCVGGF